MSRILTEFHFNAPVVGRKHSASQPILPHKFHFPQFQMAAIFLLKINSFKPQFGFTVLDLIIVFGGVPRVPQMLGESQVFPSVFNSVKLGANRIFVFRYLIVPEICVRGENDQIFTFLVAHDLPDLIQLGYPLLFSRFAAFQV